ncbi:MAG TPA: hypothetical protein VFC09_08150 [Candidatus Dormibacteraeota bacterium]|nr:hypothetical protein [Candidatus Dormibacteraeota bacterium]
MWRTVDVGDGKPAYRFWCGICGRDWTPQVRRVADRISAAGGRPAPVSTYCECGTMVRVMAFGGTLQVDDQPLRFAEETAPFTRR